jgi:hypothetical protein
LGYLCLASAIGLWIKVVVKWVLLLYF